MIPATFGPFPDDRVSRYAGTMRKAALTVFGLLLAAIPVTAQTVEHLYSPETNLERSELDQLDTATRTVDVAMYSFTDRYLAEELAVLAH